MVKIAFIDCEGTVRPTPLFYNPLTAFYIAAARRHEGEVHRCLARLHQAGVVFVWNTRAPEMTPETPAGRLHSMNGRTIRDARAEHLAMLKEVGIDESWLLPGRPEVVHRTSMTKGQAVMAFLAEAGIDVCDTVAFDDSLEEMEGYPHERFVLVQAERGITRANVLHAARILRLPGFGVKASAGSCAPR
ncbi:MAG: hypothetical protein H6865_01115 [Rhodospirillales bacterium]|nr:hypothetical protein [Alphaproteobacteria bacterium]MCB9986226.1 hypothetical protein [Rhodospirillales bacterium]USO07218.1 MAG: hypothetical protein H6866_07255 [Rhodospirillales bacterium]